MAGDGVKHGGEDSLKERLLNSEYDEVVADGSVDLHGRPVSRLTTGGWKACFPLFSMEVAERIAFYGFASNLVTYLAEELHEGLDESAKHVNYWSGVVFLTPLLGGFIADTYWGRYWTIIAGSIAHLLGSILLTVAVSLPSLKPPQCSHLSSPCPRASTWQFAVFYFSLYMITIGTGGIKPCVCSLGADQFNEEHEEEKAKKYSFFHLWYCGIGAGVIFSVTVVVYIQDNVGWGWGYGLVTAGMGLALLSFLAGTSLYRHKLPQGSPLTQFAQVVVAAISKWRAPLPSNLYLLHEEPTQNYVTSGRRKLRHTDSLRYLDKAAIEPDATTRLDNKDETVSRWRLSTLTQVEEIKLFVRMIPIWATNLLFQTVYAQTLTFFTRQASTLDGRLGPNFTIPAASFTFFNCLALMITTFTYGKFLIPVFRKFTNNPRGLSQLQRMGAGMFLAIISMAVAAATEVRRLRVATENDMLDQADDFLPMSIFWLVPQYVIGGIADSLTIVGQLEFFYDQAPDHMRSLSTAFCLSITGFGSFLSSFIITVTNSVTGRGNHVPWIVNNLNRCHLDYFYWLLAGLSAINLSFFIFFARRYAYKTIETTADLAIEKDAYYHCWNHSSAQCHPRGRK